MRGRWSRSAKHGIQFEVEGFDEVIVPSKEGVIAYLCSGQIKGKVKYNKPKELSSVVNKAFAPKKGATPNKTRNG